MPQSRTSLRTARFANRSHRALLLAAAAAWLPACSGSGDRHRPEPPAAEPSIPESTASEPPARGRTTRMPVASEPNPGETTGADSVASAPRAPRAPASKPAPKARPEPALPDADPAEAPATEPAADEPVPDDLPGEGEEALRPLTPEEVHAKVQAYLLGLCADERKAKAAFREMWNVRAEVIPELLGHVTDPRRSELREIAVLVLDTKRFFRVDEKDDSVVYTIPGMGAFEVDDVAAGKVRSGAKAILRNFDGFPVGVVVRAALINRFRSDDWPSGDDRRDPAGWWRRYYERVKPRL